MVLFQATKNVEKGSSVEAVNKLKRVASAKDEKIIELQRVIESERAVVRKAESDKLALEKQLKSLRVQFLAHLLTDFSLLLGGAAAISENFDAEQITV